MAVVNIGCLLLVLGLILVIAMEKLEGRGKDNNKPAGMEQSKAFYFLVLYGLAAIRCIGLGSIPGGFNQDGAMGAVDALALSEYGTDRFGTWLPAHFTAWGYGQMSVLLSYLTVPFIRLWGLSSLTARLPVLIVSLAGAAAVYGIVKEIVSPKAALITLLFLAINPWHFMQSRWALDCNVFPHMFIIGTYFLVRGLKNSKYFYLAMVFYALCMYSYGVSFYMVPVFLLAACIMLMIRKYVSIKQTVICVLIYLVLSFPIYGTMLINFMGWDTVKLPFVTMQYFESSIRSQDILFFSENPIRQLAVNFNALARVVFLQKPDLIWNAIDSFGTMYQCSMPLIIVGIGISFYRAKHGESGNQKAAFKILLIYWGSSIFTGICINSVNVNRINIIFYGHIIFAGIAIYYISMEWKKAAVILIGIYSILSVLFFNYYFTRWADEMEDVFYEDFLAAVEFAGELECDYYYITPDTQYNGSWNVSEILTMYAQQIDAEYYQGKTDRFIGTDIPYAERYHFCNPSQEEMDAGKNAAYVIKTDYLINYDITNFSIKRFDDYCVLVPAQYAAW